MKTPYEIAHFMLENDAFSNFLGIQILDVSAGNCTLRMNVREDMLNGFHIAHGGIAYALSDSALAFAANSHGFQCVSTKTSISHLKKIVQGEILCAQATEKYRGKNTGIYEVIVENESKQMVSLFHGHVHIFDKKW